MSEVTKLIRSLSHEQLDIITKTIKILAEEYKQKLDKKLEEIHKVLGRNEDAEDKFFGIFTLMTDAERYFIAYDVCFEVAEDITEIWTGDKEW